MPHDTEQPAPVSTIIFLLLWISSMHCSNVLTSFNFSRWNKNSEVNAVAFMLDKSTPSGDDDMSWYTNRHSSKSSTFWGIMLRSSEGSMCARSWRGFCISLFWLGRWFVLLYFSMLFMLVSDVEGLGSSCSGLVSCSASTPFVSVSLRSFLAGEQ